jgi:NDP-sugar pyrophosphorylase family protein
LGLNITYTYEDTPLGTAGPVAFVPDLDETFLVTNGDVLSTLRLNEFIQFHKDQNAIATIATHHRSVKIDLGVVQWDGDARITGYVEKPSYDYSVSMGIYVFEPEVLAYIPKGQYYDFPELVKKLIKEGEKVVGYRFDGYWQDLGRPDDYQSAADDFDSMRSQFLPGEV